MLAKYFLQVAGPVATEACGVDQLCAGLSAGIEGAVHLMQHAGMSTMLLMNGDFCSLMLAMLSMSLIGQLCCGLFDMSGPLVLSFVSIAIAIGAHMWSITTMALVTSSTVRKVLHRGVCGNGGLWSFHPPTHLSAQD